jgi:hypothetical protein
MGSAGSKAAARSYAGAKQAGVPVAAAAATADAPRAVAAEAQQGG